MILTVVVQANYLFLSMQAQTQDKLKSLEELMAQNEIKLFSLKPQYEDCKKKEEECRKM